MSRRAFCCWLVTGLALGAFPGQRLQFASPPSTSMVVGIWAVQPSVEIVVPDGLGGWTVDVVAGPLNVSAALTEVNGSALIDWRAPAARAVLNRGIANFTNFGVGAVGTYALHVAIPGFDAVVSPEFEVTAGYPVGVVLLDQPGTVTGGMEIIPPPTLGVIDNGGNVVSVPATSASVSLVAVPLGLSPGALAEAVLRGGPLTADVTSAGRAQFPGLFINLAGSGYVLRCCLNNSAVLNVTNASASACVDSAPFTVGTGPTSRLVLRSQPSGAAGGRPFAVQPVVELQDEGGNVNTADSTSTVTVSIWSDPTTGRRAVLRPRTIRRSIPPSVLLANLTHGSVLVSLSDDPWSSMASAGFRPLRPGTLLAFGSPPGVPSSGAALTAQGVLPNDDDLYVPDQFSISSGDNYTSLPPFPPPVAHTHSTRGVSVSWIFAGPQRLLRLSLPWAGPNMTLAELAVLEGGLTRPVVRGVCAFQNLTLNVAAPTGFALLFMSSLLPNKALRDPAAWDADPPAGDTAPFGFGWGRAGFGFGFGSDAHSALRGRIATVSQPFGVAPGSPFGLVVARAAAGAWAGNQPFAVQPVVNIVDAGGNILADRQDDVVVASIASPPNSGCSGANATCAPLSIASLSNYAASLIGTRAARVEDGVGEFLDLGIASPSYPSRVPFNITFSASVDVGGGATATLSVTQALRVAYSAEWMLTSFAANYDGSSCMSSSSGNINTSSSNSNLHACVDTGGGALLPRSAVANARGWALLASSDISANNNSISPGQPLLTSDSGPSIGVPVPPIDPGLPSVADRFGHAVGLAGDIAVVTAPYDDSPTPAVQVLLVSAVGAVITGVQPPPYSGSKGFTPEEQVISVNAEWVPEEQEVRLSSGNASEALNGTFTVSWGTAISRPIAVWADPLYLQEVLQQDLLWRAGWEEGGGDIGQLTVVELVRTASLRVWRITLLNVYGALPELIVDVSQCNPGANSSTTVIQPATVIGGYFTLALPGSPCAGDGASITSIATDAAAATAAYSSGCGSNSLRSTRPLPFNVNASALGAAIEQDLRTGPVLVFYAPPSTWEDNEYVGWGVGVHSWRLVYTPGPYNYDVPTLLPNASGLTGHGAEVTVDTIANGTGPLGGTFQLAVDGVVSPVFLPFNASADDIAAALLASPRVLGVDVARVGPLSGDGGYAWSITFLSVAGANGGNGDNDYYEDAYDAPPPGADVLTLASGGAVSVTVVTSAAASATLTEPLASSGSSGGTWMGGGYAWTPEGTVPPLPALFGTGARAAVYSLPLASSTSAYPLEGLSAALAGAPLNSSFGGPLQGSQGLQSGSAYVFARGQSGGWVPLQRITANDSAQFDVFGSSVAIAAPPASISGSGATVFSRGNGGPPLASPLTGPPLGTVLVVGASGVRDGGELEVQGLSCIAPPLLKEDTSAFFVLSFMGALTTEIPFSADITALRAALESAATISSVIVSGVAPGVPICDPTSPPPIRITFVAPTDGDMPPLIPLLDATAMTSVTAAARANVTVTDNVVRGSARSSGRNSTGALCGAVYVFEPANVSSASTGGVFEQVAKLSSRQHAHATSARARSTSFDGFGESVAVSCTGAGGTVLTIAVGAPSDANDGGTDAGAVYVFSRFADGVDVTSLLSGERGSFGGDDDPYDLGQIGQNAGGWSDAMPQLLTGTTHNSAGGAGFRFGASLAFDARGDTLAVGAPGANAAVGAVWLFKRQSGAGAHAFLFDQVLAPPSVSTHAQLLMLRKGHSSASLPAACLVSSSIPTPPSSGSASSSSGSGCGFGAAIALSSDVLVVGAVGAIAAAPAHAAASGSAADAAAVVVETGAAFIYDRVSWGGLTGNINLGGYFTLRQAFVDASARANDRFGAAVAAADDVVLVGAGDASHSTNPNGVAGVRGLGADQPAQWTSAGTPAHERQVIELWVQQQGEPSSGGMDGRSHWDTAAHSSSGRSSSSSSNDPPAAALNYTLGGYFLVHFDSGRVSRPIPWNASPRLLRRALQLDLHTGRVRVTRTGPGWWGAYKWVVTFLELPGPAGRDDGEGVPLLRVSSRLRLDYSVSHNCSNSSAGGNGSSSSGSNSGGQLCSGLGNAPASAGGASTSDALAAAADPRNVLGVSRLWGAGSRGGSSRSRGNSGGRVPSDSFDYSASPGATDLHLRPGVRVIRLNSPSHPIRGAVFVLTRDGNDTSVSLGYGGGWTTQARLSPYASQASDMYGSTSVVISGDSGSAMVGSPARDVAAVYDAGGSVNAGAVFAYDLSFLNLRAAVQIDVDDVSSVPSVSEGGSALNRLARGHYTGLGVSDTNATVAFNVCVPACRVPPPRPFFSVSSNNSSNTTVSGSIGSGNGSNVSSTSAYVAYVTVAPGNDWGPPSWTQRQLPIDDGGDNDDGGVDTAVRRRRSRSAPAGALAARANGAPASLIPAGRDAAEGRSGNRYRNEGDKISLSLLRSLCEASSISSDGSDDGYFDAEAAALSYASSSRSQYLSWHSHAHAHSVDSSSDQEYNDTLYLEEAFEHPHTHAHAVPTTTANGPRTPSDVLMARRCRAILHKALLQSFTPESCGVDSLGTDECMFLHPRVNEYTLGVAVPRSAYDWGAAHDYIRIHSESVLEVVSNVSAVTTATSTSSTFNVTIPIVNDATVETPDEVLHIRLDLPGMAPLWGGELWTAISIADNGDGIVGGKAYLQQSFFGSSGSGAAVNVTALLQPALNASAAAVAAADVGICTSCCCACNLTNRSSTTTSSSDTSVIGPESTRGYRFGASLALDSGGRVAVVGSPGAPCVCALLNPTPSDCGSNTAGLGAASIIVVDAATGTWRTVALLDAGTAAAAITPLKASFGTAVALVTPSFMWTGGGGAVGSLRTFAAISAPGAVLVRMFSWNASDAAAVAAVGAASLPLSVTLEAELHPLTDGDAHPSLIATVGYRTLHAPSSGDGFGGPRALAMSDDGAGGIIVAVGCPGLEAVFVFRWGLGLGGVTAATMGASASSWRQSIILRASDYAEVPMALPRPQQQRTSQQGVAFPFVARFGASVSMSGQTLGVGAPLSTFNASGSPEGQFAAFATGQSAAEASASAVGHGSGAVYIFQFVGGVSTEDYSSATHAGSAPASWSVIAGWPAADASLRAGQPVFVFDDGGGDAVWAQHAVLTALDARAGARFGASLALNGQSALVGAPGAGDAPQVTWNFESGDLRGWSARGAAFANQPTYGDNPRDRRPAARDVLDAAQSRVSAQLNDLRARFQADADAGTRPDVGDVSAAGAAAASASVAGAMAPLRTGGASGVEGRYFLGTYENRPAEGHVVQEPEERGDYHRNNNSHGSIHTPSAGGPTTGVHSRWAVNDPTAEPSAASAGGVGGNAATGSLTSAPFRIAGDTMSVLVGGGCDDRRVYVELLIDGISVLRATGGCVEAMQRVSWDLRSFAGRSGVVRIVDDAADASDPWGHINVDDFRFSWDIGRFEETDGAGAVYVFERVAPGAPPATRNAPQLTSPCPRGTPALSCVWSLSSRIVPGDKRRGAGFGWDVALDDVAGLALVSEEEEGEEEEGASDAFCAAGVAEEVEWEWSSLELENDGMGEHTIATSAAGRRALQQQQQQQLLQEYSRRTGGADDFARHSPHEGRHHHPHVGGRNSWSLGRPELLPAAGRARGGSSSVGLGAIFENDDRSANGDSGGKGGGLSLQNNNPFFSTIGIDASATTRRLCEHSRSSGEVAQRGTTRLVYVVRRTPAKYAGGGFLMSSAQWPSLSSDPGVSLVEVPTSTGEFASMHAHRDHAAPESVLRAVALRGFTALIGIPVDSRLAPHTGTLWSVDLGYTLLSFDSRDAAAPSDVSGVDSDFQFDSSYTLSEDGALVYAFTVAEGNSRGEVVVPVYRPGMGVGPGGVPRESSLASSGTVHVYFATADGSAEGVTARRGAQCLSLPVSGRARAGCGDYVSQAGMLVFPPGILRRDIIIPLMDDDEYEFTTESFVVRLFVPGGARILGYGYAVEIRIDDDDDVDDDEFRERS